MEIGELREKLQGVYDFTNVVDCHSVISMLLRDLFQEKTRADALNSELKVLAKLVVDDSPEGKDKANAIMKGVRRPVNVMDFLGRMTDRMNEAESMDDTQLHDAAIQIWADFNMDSMESGILGEILKRFKEGKHDKTEVAGDT